MTHQNCYDAATLANAATFLVVPWTAAAPHPPITLCRGTTLRFVWGGGDAGVTQVQAPGCPSAPGTDVVVAAPAASGDVGVTFDAAGTYFFVDPRHCDVVQEVRVVDG